MSSGKAYSVPRIFLAICLIFAGFAAVVAALVLKEPDAEHQQRVGRETGLPVPRFVSLKSGPANVRQGPSLKHPIKWIFKRESIPLEVLAEFDSWRKIRDFDGATGWIHRALIGSARKAWVAPWESGQLFALRSEPRPDASTLATAEPKVLVSVNHCSGTWCSVTKESFDGYIRQQSLWGVYPNEVIDDRSVF